MAISWKRCKIENKLVLITNRKSHMSFRLIPRYDVGNLSIGGLNARVVAKYSEFGPIEGYISEMVEHNRLVTINRIWALDWYENRWPWMTLNGLMVVILRYFTELVFDVVVKQLLGLLQFQSPIFDSMWAHRYDLHDYSATIWAKQTDNSLSWAYVYSYDYRCID